jgi:prenyltransferase beta subunit
LIGIQGRVGKIPDSCYSFWVGASIKILTDKNLLNPKV